MAPFDVSICLHAFGIVGCGSFHGVGSSRREGVWVVIRLFLLAGSMLLHRTVGMLSFYCHHMPLALWCSLLGSCVAYCWNSIYVAWNIFHLGLHVGMMLDFYAAHAFHLRLAFMQLLWYACSCCSFGYGACDESGLNCPAYFFRCIVALNDFCLGACFVFRSRR